MMQRRHAMPFGAELAADRCRFRLWAPSAKRVDLVLDGISHPLSAAADGWYERTIAARAGSRYRFRVDGGQEVPDPASRFQPDDVHGPSEVIDPTAFAWKDEGWRGRVWEEAVVYELHVGSFTAAGNFNGVRDRLDHLVDLGVTAIELMPLADFPGQRNWGYDGVLPYAPDSRYGRPEDLKELVQAAHARGLMVLLDVVYNHFGPEGNYLSLYAAPFFTDRHQTPWGAAINFDGPGSRVVRDYYIHNALFWLEEYHFDGLRLDAVHAIHDDSAPSILEEIADAVGRGPGAQRRVHLVLENDDNAARYFTRTADGKPRWYTAQWNDDVHHAFHVLGTGETGGYYGDYAADPVASLGRCLAEGFAYQGEPSPYRDGARRGEPSNDLPPTAFVSFLQNHDQIGNRAFGERLSQLAEPDRLKALTAILLLAPSPPLLFMGQEWAARQPFPFFCDFGPELARAVTEGRRKEFARFPEFNDEQARRRIPDPSDAETFQQAILDWSVLSAGASPANAALKLHRELLALRAQSLVPRLAGIRAGGHYRVIDRRGLAVTWSLADNDELSLLANLSSAPLASGERFRSSILYSTHPWRADADLPAWSVYWFLNAKGTGHT